MNSIARNEKLRNLILLGTIFAIVGLGLSCYSLMHHLELKQIGHTSFACNINETFSCDDVANSKFAEDPWGNPLGVYGISYFAGLLVLLVMARIKESLQAESLQAYAVVVTIGAITSVTLLGISEFIIGKICPTCVGIYLVTFVQFAILIACKGGIPTPWTIKNIFNGGWYNIIVLAVVIIGFQKIHKPLTNTTAETPKTGEELAEVKKAIADNSGPGPLAMLDTNVSPSVKADLTAYSGLGEDYHKGSPDAKVKIIEYADFQCPACAAASKSLRTLHDEFGDKVLMVFKNFPLNKDCNNGVQSQMHPYACQAARIARCAGANGKFWDMHNQFFDNQANINDTSVVAWAKEIGGLTDAQVKDCLASADVAAKLQDDAKQASEAGLQGTPTLFFNGQKYNGNADTESLRGVIQALLAK